MNVTIELIGIRGQDRVTPVRRFHGRLPLVQLGDNRAVWYRLADGISSDHMGRPTAWQFWSVSADCLAALAEEYRRRKTDGPSATERARREPPRKLPANSPTRAS